MMNCLGDAHHWSENTCWIFDADFEYLCNDSVVQLVCTGARCRDYKLRLLMAGCRRSASSASRTSSGRRSCCAIPRR